VSKLERNIKESKEIYTCCIENMSDCNIAGKIVGFTVIIYFIILNFIFGMLFFK
jgi:hypothetical protein